MSPKGYFQLLYKVFFKAISFGEEVREMSTKKKLIIFLWLGPYNLVFIILISVPLLLILGRGQEEFLLQTISPQISGGVNYIAKGLGVGAIGTLLLPASTLGIAIAVAFGLAFGMAKIMGGISMTIVATAAVVNVIFSHSSLAKVLGQSIISIMIVLLGLGFALAMFFWGNIVMTVAIWLWFIFLLISFRSFYWPWLWFHELKQPDNPLIWDQNISFPVPWLSLVLQRNARRHGVSTTASFATFLIQERPVQRKAAQRGLVLIATDMMKSMPDIHSLTTIKQSLSFMPDPEEISEGYTEGYQNLSKIAQDIKSALEDYNLSNQQLALQKVKDELTAFERKNNFSRKTEALSFGQVATHWQDILQTEIARLENEQGRPLPNPFVTGRPIQPGGEMFVGRKDIIDQIQTEVLRSGQSGAILFQGNRRTGKTSTLNNMVEVLPSYILPIYLSSQDPETHNTEDFCEHLVGKVADIFPKFKTVSKIQTFVELSKFLRKLDSELQTSGATCLICLDEYERLGSRILSGKLAGLHDSLRVWVQQLNQVVFLFAGSHAISELPDIDWTDYLIEVRTVPISFLDQAAAMKLVTQPIPEYDLSYESKNLPKDLVHRLGFQPYLIQCAMYELTEILNQDGNRRLANVQDIDKAVEQTFSTSRQHFQHLWQSELNESEREAIRKFVNGESFPNDSAALRKLQRREVLKKNDGTWEFCIPVFREWLYQEGEI